MLDSLVAIQSRLFVHALTGKRLELSTPNLVHVCVHVYIALARHALTERSKGQGNMITKNLVTMTRIA